MLKRKIAILTFFLLFTAGCGFWSNVTTYFNRYYNAQKLFNEAKENYLKNVQLFTFKYPKPSSKDNEAFKKVIEKTSKILQFNKESSYFDDALFMTGQSLFFQQNYAKAERKFKELLRRNNEEYNLQAKLWIAKTELQLRKFEDGIEHLIEVKDEALSNDEEIIAVDALVSVIAYYKYDDDFESASKGIEDLLSFSTSEELNAEITYELGILYEEQQEWEKAAYAYKKVLDYSPTFEVEFSSLISYAKILRILGKHDESLNILDELYNEDKYKEYLSQVELEIGLNFYDTQEYERALNKFIEVDSVYKSDEYTGLAEFNAGEILEKYYNDYDSAKVFYSKAGRSRAPVDFRKIANARVRLFDQYSKLKNNLVHNRTQYLYKIDSTLFIRDSIEYEEWRYRDSVRKAEMSQTSTPNSQRGVRGRSTATVPGKKDKQKVAPKKPILSADSLKVILTKSQLDMGNFFFSELENIDSAKAYFDIVLENYPDSLFNGQELYALGVFYSNLGDTLLSKNLFEKVYERFKGEDVAVEAAKRLGFHIEDNKENPIELKYEEAEKLFLDSNFYAAIDSLEVIYKKYKDSEYAPKALYTTGFILEEYLNNLDSARAVYDTLITKYKTTEYARKVAPKLGFYKNEMKRLVAEAEKAKKDSIMVAQKAVQDSLKSNVEAVDSVKSLKTFADSLRQSILLERENIKKGKATKKDSTKKALKKNKIILER